MNMAFCIKYKLVIKPSFVGFCYKRICEAQGKDYISISLGRTSREFERNSAYWDRWFCTQDFCNGFFFNV